MGVWAWMRSRFFRLILSNVYGWRNWIHLSFNTVVGSGFGGPGYGPGWFWCCGYSCVFRRISWSLFVFAGGNLAVWITIGDSVLFGRRVSFLVVEVMTRVLLFRLKQHVCLKACFRRVIRFGSLGRRPCFRVLSFIWPVWYSAAVEKGTVYPPLLLYLCLWFCFSFKLLNYILYVTFMVLVATSVNLKSRLVSQTSLRYYG